jgi:hypothetical protein
MQGGEASGSHGACGRTTQNPFGWSQPATNPQAWEPTSDDDGRKDDEIDLPSAHAPIIRGFVLHRVEARRSGNELVTDFTATGGSALLQDIRFQNPAFHIRDARIDGNRFWTLHHVDFYNLVILPKKHQPILHQRYINWEGYEAIGDLEMTQALRACERKKMKPIMTFQYDWNDEVIAQFYSTLWIKLADEKSPYNFPYLNFYIEGSWYKVSYRRFAHILGFTDDDISGDKVKIHDFRQPTKDEARDLHLFESGKFWESTNMHKYYRYINSLSKMTLIPKGGNQMNILGESKVLLSFMKPNSSESINIFDMIWQEIIHAACFPLKGCLHAPFIMKMIEVVTQFRYEKGTRHQSYIPFWIDPNNPAGRLRKAPSSSRAHTSAGPAAAAGASRPSPGRGSPTPRGHGRGRGRGRGMGARLAHGIAAFFLCAEIFLQMCMSWQGVRGRLTTIFVVKLLLWACLLTLARLTCLSIRLLQKSMSGTSRPTGCLLCQLTMMKKKNTLMIVSSLPRLPTRGIRVNPLLILHPRIRLKAILPQISLGKNNLHLTWRIISLLRIILLLTGDLWLGGSLLFWFLLPKRGRRISHLSSSLIYVMNNLVCNNYYSSDSWCIW